MVVPAQHRSPLVVILTQPVRRIALNSATVLHALPNFECRVEGR